MAGRLAAVPEESMDGSTAAYPPRSPYRDLIRRVAVSGTQIRCALFSHSQSGHSGSSYTSDSGTSNSYPSNNSGCSSRSASAAAADFGTQELKTIARRMVSDGYAQRMVQAFSDASPAPASPAALGYVGDSDEEMMSLRFPELLGLDGFAMVPATARPTHVCTEDQDRVLETWFFELDVDWVLQIRQEHDSQWQFRLQNISGSSLQDLVEKWIRGLRLIVYTIAHIQYTLPELMEVNKRFGKASIFKMLVFADAIVPAFKAENLRAVLDMYICLVHSMDNSDLWWVRLPLSLDRTLLINPEKAINAISSTMEKIKTLVEYDDSWAMEIPRGGGGVHMNTRWIADCVVSLAEAEAGSAFLSISYGERLSGLREDTIDYLKGLLVRKSELCSDPSLRYLFLLNNSYFAANMVEPCRPGHDWVLTPECEEYMDSYLDVSWGHVLSCIPKSHFPGPLHRRINTSKLVKFEAAFNKTYQAQKFWKVPDPQLRYVLRRAITGRVVSSYLDYLNEHPELAEQVSRRNSTPKVLEEMLSQIFEG